MSQSPARRARRQAAGQAPPANRQQVKLVVTQLRDAVARQLALQANPETAASNDALFNSARDVRRQAQALLDAGDKRAAAALVAQAELLESAAQALPGS